MGEGEPQESFMRQNTPKIPLTLFCVDHLILGIKPVLEVLFIPSGILLEKTNFRLRMVISWREILF